MLQPRRTFPVFVHGHTIKWLLAFFCAVVPVASLRAQEAKKEEHVVVPRATPRSEDVGSIDGIVKAYYSVITGPPGRAREWDRDRTLYIPDLRFVAVGVDKAGKPNARIMSHQQFVDAENAQMVKEGFDEREIHRVTQPFGNIAHVFSTYETRNTPGGPLIGRGINSIELFWDGKRWWIASAIWDEERPDNPIPKDYLP
jgi:hypothetical protein